MSSASRAPGSPAAFARLRLRIWRASLRGGSPAEIATLIVSLLAPLAGLAIGIAIFAALRLVTDDLVPTLEVLICAAIGLLTVLGGLVLSVNISVDLRVIAAEPITSWRRALGSLVTVMVGPAGAVAVAVGLGLGAGALRSWRSVPIVALSVIVLMSVTFLLSRATSGLLGLLANRYRGLGQIVIGLAAVALWGLYMFSLQVAPRLSSDQLTAGAQSLRWVPIASLGWALAGALSGGFGPPQAWLTLAWNAAWLLPLAGAFWFATSRFANSVPRATLGRTSGRRRWRTLLGHGPAAVVATRTVTTFARDSRFMMSLTVAYVIALAAVVGPTLFLDAGAWQAPLTMVAISFPGFVAASNCFGMDGPALAHEVLAGASVRTLILGKLRAVLLLTAPLAVTAPLLAAAINRSGSLLIASVAIAAGAWLLGAAVAAALSALFPFAVTETDNPFGSTGSPNLVTALLLTGAVMIVGALLIPVLIGAGLALDLGGTLVGTAACLVAGAYLAGISWLAWPIANARLRGRAPELLADITPKR